MLHPYSYSQQKGNSDEEVTLLKPLPLQLVLKYRDKLTVPGGMLGQDFRTSFTISISIISNNLSFGNVDFSRQLKMLHRKLEWHFNRKFTSLNEIKRSLKIFIWHTNFVMNHKKKLLCDCLA